MTAKQASRPPAVAGLFYPADPKSLTRQVDRLMEAARADLHSIVGVDAGAPKALILPHAGYVYSGSCAALGHALLHQHRDSIERVVLLGPAHRVALRGIAVDPADAFETPLGPVRTDPHAAAGLPGVVESAEPHAPEHSLEVHLPFLQRSLGDVPVLPLLVGTATPESVAAVLEAVWDGPGTVIIVSSDLSHYLPYDQARAKDKETLTQVLALAGPLAPEQACGAGPVNGLIVAARSRGVAPHLLGQLNSGDTAGDRRRVVGYAAIGFWAQDGPR